MKSLWTQHGADEAIQRWSPKHGTEFALRLYSARLMGSDRSLVLHGGGNVSLKGPFKTVFGETVEALFVKASGCDLAAIEPSDLTALDLKNLSRLRDLEKLGDPEMVNQFRTHLFDASSGRPSIETLLHAFLPHRFIDHSHADAVLAITNQPEAATGIREALGDGVAIVPYVRPGFDLAKAVAAAVEATPDVHGVVLLHHGLVTFGDDARRAYEKHIEIVDACERYVENRIKGRALTVSFSTEEDPGKLASRAAPILRGLLATRTDNEDQPFGRSILDWRATKEILGFVNSAEASSLASTGALTPDHVIRTKCRPLFVDQPDWSHDDRLRKQFEDATKTHREEDEAHVRAWGSAPADFDSSPRVVLLPGAGAFCWGKTKRDARIAADITEQTLVTKVRAHLAGGYASLPQEHLHEMELRPLQRMKLGDGNPKPLDGQVVVISGGAGAIGASIAEVCGEAGAHVVVTDLPGRPIERVVERVEAVAGAGAAVGIEMDTTDERSVHDGFDEILRTYGGVDVAVPNAGIAHVAPIDELLVEDFRRVMEVNATGYFLFMKEAARIMKLQGLGGNIVINASKNVFAPGKDFGAYSASKAACHQLGKVAAIELAPFGIRVNMINADAIFGDEDNPSGLWKAVGPSRARRRRLEPGELPEYYRGRNLLKARVRGYHVGRAVVFFASNATPTTGATLPVDGGVVEAFPR